MAGSQSLPTTGANLPSRISLARSQAASFRRLARSGCIPACPGVEVHLRPQRIVVPPSRWSEPDETRERVRDQVREAVPDVPEEGGIEGPHARRGRTGLPLAD